LEFGINYLDVECPYENDPQKRGFVFVQAFSTRKRFMKRKTMLSRTLRFVDLPLAGTIWRDILGQAPGGFVSFAILRNLGKSRRITMNTSSVHETDDFVKSYGSTVWAFQGICGIWMHEIRRKEVG
jgi:hypothetical protein